MLAGGRCPKHAAQVRRESDQARPTRTARLYSNRWDRARSTFLRSHPLCAYCLELGCLTPATAVDHFVPHRGDQALFWDESNWRATCAPCHSSKTAREDGGFGNARAR